MARTELNNEALEMVTGGSIKFSGDKKTCGYNCDNQYAINDFTKLKAYYSAHYKTMTEPQMLAEMLTEGIISNL